METTFARSSEDTEKHWKGPSRGSLGTPTVEVEKLAMSLALKDAEVLAAQVSFVEPLGTTGTAVGDPVEMEAIAEVYSEGTHRTARCVISQGQRGTHGKRLWNHWIDQNHSGSLRTRSFPLIGP